MHITMNKFSVLEQRIRKLANLGDAIDNPDIEMFESCVHRARAIPSGVGRGEAIQKLVESGVPEDIATYAVVAAEILNKG